MSEKSSNIPLSLEMMALGLETVRQKFRRENPGATEEDIEQLLIDWYLRQPRYGLFKRVSWPARRMNQGTQNNSSERTT